MAIRWPRILLGAFVAEALPVLLLVALVALLGPGEAIADTAFAEELGMWVGPIAGAVATALIAWWLAKGTPTPLRHGIVLGTLVAAIDAGIVLAADTPITWLFVASWVGRIVAGAIGGGLAARTRDG